MVLVAPSRAYREAGLKTDVMLAAYGYQMMDEYVNEVLHDDEFEHPKFYQQIFRLLEDMRVFNHIRNERQVRLN